MTDVIMVDGSVGASNNSNLPLNMNNSVISVTMAAAAAAAAAAGGTGTTSPTLGGTSPVSAAAAAAAMMMMQPPASCSSSSSSSSSSTSAAAIAAAAAAAAANTQSVADYLAQLLKDKKQLAALPNVFHHVERLLDEEIGKVRGNLFQINGTEKKPMVLPDAVGAAVNLSEKVYVPVKEFPDFNFVGRILGPRGMTAKQLEQETGCKIMVRGRGSMRDKKKEEQNRGKPNWEHLNDELHVLITVEDTENRAKVKLQRAVDEIRKLLVPAADGEDELKKRQLMELAIINGTYRDPSAKLGQPGGGVAGNVVSGVGVGGGKGADLLSIWFYETQMLQQYASRPPSPAINSYAPRLLQPGVGLGSPGGLRNPSAGASQLEYYFNQASSKDSWNGIAGAPLILSPRGMQHSSAASSMAALLNSAASGGPPPLISAADAAAGLLYSPYAAAAAAEYSNYAAAAAAAAGLSSQLLAEYQTGVPSSNDGTAGGASGKLRRHLGSQGREHPYQRNDLN
ncbi:protein quaking isoform X2 [Daphnia magna]|uniref:protein quaking isoform X2 n=1 Tax=Daphnia magna TaxID=35525 RepID=UPI001E1BCA12|nr:protein quaking isoform X2 [Daphnia magna]